jgi:hypothetical protein
MKKNIRILLALLLIMNSMGKQGMKVGLVFGLGVVSGRVQVEGDRVGGGGECGGWGKEQTQRSPLEGIIGHRSLVEEKASNITQKGIPFLYNDPILQKCKRLVKIS